MAIMLASSCKGITTLVPHPPAVPQIAAQSRRLMTSQLISSTSLSPPHWTTGLFLAPSPPSLPLSSSLTCAVARQTSTFNSSSDVTPQLVTTQQVGETEVETRQRLFNRIAPIYDMLNDWLSLGQHRVWKRMAVAWSGAKKGDYVLDICCGSGDVVFLLEEKVRPTGMVVGLDYAQEQLDVASWRQFESTHSRSAQINWCLGDALDLPFENASFDAVTMAYGLRNVASVPLALKEIYNVLKPGARASILDFNRSENSDVLGFQEAFYLELGQCRLARFYPDYISYTDDFCYRKDACSFCKQIDWTDTITYTKGLHAHLLQGWMLDNIVVPVASQFGLQDEYAYLKKSIACFPTGGQQEELALEAGFSRAVHYELAGGLMGVLVVTK